MHHVEGLAVDHGRELLVLIERRLLRAPVEPAAPVLGELRQVHQRDAAAEVGAVVPAFDGDRPACVGEPAAQVVDVGLRGMSMRKGVSAMFSFMTSTFPAGCSPCSWPQLLAEVRTSSATTG